MSEPHEMPSLDQLRRHLEDGPSLLIATRDGELRSDVTRCSAARVLASGTVVVAVNMPDGRQAIENVHANGQIALTAARPTTYACLQVKGSGARVEAWPEQARALAFHRSIFVGEIVKAGLPARQADAVLTTECITVAFTPDVILDQTPGANVRPQRP
jgi:hypothetical protein